jgi:hypothetical protein
VKAFAPRVCFVRVYVLSILFVFIHLCWCSIRTPYHMIFVSQDEDKQNKPHNTEDPKDEQQGPTEKPRCSGSVSSSCSPSGTRRVNLVTNPVISHKRRKERRSVYEFHSGFLLRFSLAFIYKIHKLLAIDMHLGSPPNIGMTCVAQLILLSIYVVLIFVSSFCVLLLTRHRQYCSQDTDNTAHKTQTILLTRHRTKTQKLTQHRY